MMRNLLLLVCLLSAAALVACSSQPSANSSPKPTPTSRALVASGGLDATFSADPTAICRSTSGDWFLVGKLGDRPANLTVTRAGDASLIVALAADRQPDPKNGYRGQLVLKGSAVKGDLDGFGAYSGKRLHLDGDLHCDRQNMAPAPGASSSPLVVNPPPSGQPAPSTSSPVPAAVTATPADPAARSDVPGSAPPTR